MWSSSWAWCCHRSRRRLQQQAHRVPQKLCGWNARLCSCCSGGARARSSARLATQRRGMRLAEAAAARYCWMPRAGSRRCIQLASPTWTSRATTYWWTTMWTAAVPRRFATLAPRTASMPASRRRPRAPLAGRHLSSWSRPLGRGRTCGRPTSLAWAWSSGRPPQSPARLQSTRSAASRATRTARPSLLAAALPSRRAGPIAARRRTWLERAGGSRQLTARTLRRSWSGWHRWLANLPRPRSRVQ
mmetsp:Transcript_91966/g.297602  ORF Transcript_91966/g.297602 Transcript_91966/m.297602 type:complete len:245 (-) Transcript_91966:88-822(-)